MYIIIFSCLLTSDDNLMTNCWELYLNKLLLAVGFFSVDVDTISWSNSVVQAICPPQSLALLSSHQLVTSNTVMTLTTYNRTLW